ncbi:MAG: hypothetical protein K2X27_27970 [Candidatus Obscuribacterales bacterium]|nr:hypothetical protein [Candidatus Obscuribacterales bacterium]
MQLDEKLETPQESALKESRALSAIIASIDESILLLCQKRRTLEEKAIIAYFHSLAVSAANIISCLHKKLSNSNETLEEWTSLLERLRTVNENIASCLEELLKILKYNFNFLEQYFEYDYLSRLLNNDSELLRELEELEADFKKHL